MRKRIEKNRHSYRGDLVGHDFAKAKKKNPPPGAGRDLEKSELIGDTTIEQISGDPYLADLIKKHGQE